MIRFWKYLLLVLFILPAPCLAEYKRADFNFRSYSPNTYTGWYTGQPCSQINIDHVVSLQDAFKSGASSWSNAKKETFANDRLNYVPACASVNRSKGASIPKDVIRKARDGKRVSILIFMIAAAISKGTIGLSRNTGFLWRYSRNG